MHSQYSDDLDYKALLINLEHDYFDDSEIINIAKDTDYSVDQAIELLHSNYMKHFDVHL